MGTETFIRSEGGVGVVNTDIAEYQKAIARREQAKYIKSLEQRIVKLESAMALLEQTFEEITK